MENFKKKIGRIKNRRLFITFFMILVLGITVAIISTAGFLYYNYTENIKKQVGISSLGQLKQAKTIINLVFAEIDRTSGQFLYDEQINDTMNNLLLKKENFLYNLNKLGERIVIINGWNKAIHSIYIYLEDEQGSYVLSSIPSEIYNINDFYDKYWLDFYNSGLSYSQILSTHVFEKGTGNLRETANIITHIRPITFPNINRGAIIINIDEDQLAKIITDSIVRDTEVFLAINENDEIFISSDSSLLYKDVNEYLNIDFDFDNGIGYSVVNVNGADMIITYTSSEEYGWRYISLTPTDIVYKDIKSINRKIISICILFIISGIFISFLLSSRVYKPISVLLDTIRTSMNIKGEKESRDEVGFLNEIFGEIFGENKSLEKTVENLLPAIKEKFFRTVISSDIMKKEEYEDKIKSLNIPFNTEYFQVAIFEINSKDRKKMVKTMQAESLINVYIKNLIQNEFSNGNLNILTQEITIDNIGVIINFESEPKEIDALEIISLCEDTVKRCKDYMNIRLYSAIGKQVASSRQLPESYNSALETLKYKQLSGIKRVLSYNEIENYNSIDMDLLFERVDVLTNYFSVCDIENVRTTIRDIIDSFKIQKTEFRNIKNIIIRILGYIGKSAEDMAVDHSDVLDNENVFSEVDKLETLDEIENYLLEKCDVLNKRNMQKISSRNWQMTERVKAYIRTNISSDIILDDVVSLSGMSSSHFSRVFKEETGSTFVECLNNIRVEKAIELLENTDYKIKDISGMVGFRNQTYFITTFKSIKGMTPNNYKNMFLWKKMNKK